MLSYQHIYHAGCMADVQKHAALAVVLAQMVKKEKPITYIETHAGRGLYDLKSKEAEKTREALRGIIPLLESAKIAPGHPYRAVIEAVKAQYGESFYPGSPMVAKNILRKEDKLFLMELHPQEFDALKHYMNYRNVFVHNQDGYKQALAVSPPLIRRGLVLVDPSYEIKTDYEATAKFILELHRKWPEAVVMLWYPILKQGLHKPMVGELLAANLPKTWQQEIMFKADTEYNALGTGLLCFNMPYGVEDELARIEELF